jgi:hypothetical protein
MLSLVHSSHLLPSCSERSRLTLPRKGGKQLPSTSSSTIYCSLERSVTIMISWHQAEDETRHHRRRHDGRKNNGRSYSSPACSNSTFSSCSSTTFSNYCTATAYASATSISTTGCGGGKNRHNRSYRRGLPSQSCTNVDLDVFLLFLLFFSGCSMLEVAVKSPPKNVSVEVF